MTALRPSGTMPVAFPTARFRPLDGRIELAVAEAAEAAAPRPVRVTAILAAMCGEIGGEAGGRPAARKVSAAGREWLLQRAALRFHGSSDWFEAPCGACGARFDVSLSISETPRAKPAAGFPVTEVETSLGRRVFEAPNGGHEEALTRRGGEDPRRVFAALCGLSPEAEADAIRFTPTDLSSIDAAIEAASPDIADSVDVACPDCGAETAARIDPLAFAFPRLSDVLAEVHMLAAHYHWAEDAILALPLPRRRAYAALIRADRRGGRR